MSFISQVIINKVQLYGNFLLITLKPHIELKELHRHDEGWLEWMLEF